VDTYSALIERYGSPNAFARVHAILDEQVGKMACYEQSKLLGYCLRADSPGSIELVRRAVTARGKEDTHCYSATLREAAELHTILELEKLAIEFLDDDDPEAVILSPGRNTCRQPLNHIFANASSHLLSRITRLIESCSVCFFMG
jgi:hypothetical protein